MDCNESYFMFIVLFLFGLEVLKSFFCMLLVILVILGISYLKS